MADTSHVFSAPLSVVEAYLEHGGADGYTGSDSISDAQVECPAGTPGWDAWTIVTNWKVIPVAQTPDRVQYVVEFDRYGLVDMDTAGTHLVRDSAIERDTIVVVRKPYGWRIHSPEFNPHVLPDAARKRRVWSTGDQQTLDSLVAHGARASRPGA